MNQITVLRHAKSRWDNDELADFDRPLDERGWRMARVLGMELKRRAFRFDVALASPAIRVRETIEALQDAFNFSTLVRFEKAMYLAGEEELVAILQDLPESVHHPLLIGHNPGLQHFLLMMSEGQNDAIRARLEHKFPTAALAVLNLAASRWNEIKPGCATIIELILPGEL